MILRSVATAIAVTVSLLAVFVVATVVLGILIDAITHL